ncbi:hypothetical protein [Microbispora sp. NPDC049633]|uniref:hypothetical protein n=1 Tax=Microbispora sp. NPDC049633 TaxID=3154355 RepID=UPI003434C8A5
MGGFDLVLVLGVIVAPLLSLAVGFVTKESWSPAVKALALAALSAADGFVVAWHDTVQDGGVFDWKTALIFAIGAFIAGDKAHRYVWEPSGAAGVAQRSLVKDRQDLAA